MHVFLCIYGFTCLSINTVKKVKLAMHGYMEKKSPMYPVKNKNRVEEVKKTVMCGYMEKKISIYPSIIITEVSLR